MLSAYENIMSTVINIIQLNINNLKTYINFSKKLESRYLNDHMYIGISTSISNVELQLVREEAFLKKEKKIKEDIITLKNYLSL